MAQIGKFSDLWIWGVANLRFNYLRCFSINFENCCAHLAANFLYFPNIPNFLYLDGFEETYGQKTKNIGNQKNANLSKSWNLTFFDDEISKLFFHSYGPRIPKWNFAHHLWSKQAQNIRKTPQNTWFTDPCFKSLQTGHPVELVEAMEDTTAEDLEDYEDELFDADEISNIVKFAVETTLSTCEYENTKV